MSENRDRLTVIDAEPDAFAFCVRQNVVVSVWWKQATGPAATRLDAVIRATLREFPQGFSSVHVVKESALLPDADGRKELMRMMRDYQHNVGCVAVIIGGTGFWASAFRAAVTGMWITTTQAVDLRLMGTYDEAAAWIPAKHQARTSVRIDASEVMDLLRKADSRALTQVKARQSA